MKDQVAIIGMGCRFPGGVRGPQEFWNFLTQGGDAVVEIPPDRWNIEAFYDPEPGKPGKSSTKWGGFLDQIDRFDPEPFGISQREAPFLDPQQRLLLEVVKDALDDGSQQVDGIRPLNAGVFVGISTIDYAMRNASPMKREGVDPYFTTGTAPSIAANRISYCFNLSGPSLAVDTACSSSLLALHLACRSLADGECELAIAAGVNCLIGPATFVAFSSMRMLSPTGRCHAFDASADGFVRGEGAGAVLLKPLTAALRDNNPIYAVIRGTATNQDGHKGGLTQPNQEAQEKLLARACEVAGIRPSEIQYVEAHGTGTATGDPIEAEALGNVLGRGREDVCLIGSVKTNIGHLEAASGIAGAIKTALSLSHRLIPPSLHCDSPNPQIDFSTLKLRVVQSVTPYREGRMFAGVNSFGFGGANVHVILEAPPERKSPPPPAEDGPLLLPLSAAGPEALIAMADMYSRFLRETPDHFDGICRTAGTGRTHFKYRLAVTAASKEEAAEKLEAYPKKETLRGMATGEMLPGNGVVFVFNGQGTQWWAMGRELWKHEPVFTAKIQECHELLAAEGKFSLLDELFATESNSLIDRTEIAQPAIFSLQVALAAILQDRGIVCDGVIGHSVGEVAAVHIAGAMSLPDAIKVIYQRGRCMGLAPEGRMLAAAITAERASEIVSNHSDRLWLAAINSPASVTISGAEADIAALHGDFESEGIFSRVLKTRHAFHSAHMDPVREELLACLQGIAPRPSDIPIYSTVEGGLISGGQMDAMYWWRNVRETVRFADAVLAAAEHAVFVEIGAHPALSTVLSECLQREHPHASIVPTLRRHAGEKESLCNSLGKLFVAGRYLPSQDRASGSRLPGYPWQRKRFWNEPGECVRARFDPPAHPLFTGELEAIDPTWECNLDQRLFPWLGDHRVQGKMIFPAAGYVELALAVSREMLGTKSMELKDVVFHRACILPDAGPALRMRAGYSRRDQGFQIASGIGRDQVMHASGRMNEFTGQKPETRDLESLRKRCASEIPYNEMYARLEENGLKFGASFQGLRSIHRRDGEAFVIVNSPASREGYLAHPAQLDSCFQSIAAAIPAGSGGADRLFLPVAIDSIVFHHPLPIEVWCHIRLTKSSASVLEAELCIMDASGQVLMEVRGFCCKAVGHIADAMASSIYDWKWIEQAGEPADGRADGGGTLIFSDQAGIGTELGALFSNSSFVVRGDRYLRLSAETREISPGNPDDFICLINEMGSVQRIVFLWPLDFCADNDLALSQIDQAEQVLCHALLHLVQAMAATGQECKEFWIVTQGAQAVGNSPLAIRQAALPGLARVIMNEYPDLNCRILDLDPNEDVNAPDIFEEIFVADAEQEIAWRGGVRQVPRLMRAGPGTGSAEPQSVSLPNVPCRLEVGRAGTLDSLEIRRFVRRAPRTGEVEIEVCAAALNFRDVMKALGIYPGDPPITLGDVCSGRVVSVGDGVEEFQPGDEVIALGFGCLSSHLTVTAGLVATKPQRLSFVEATTLPNAFLTASYALRHLARLAPGERVLIHAAAGGVGLAAVHIALATGAEIFATAGSDEKRDYLRVLGVPHVMDSRSLAFADEIRETTRGEGIDVVLNSLSGEAMKKSLSLLREGGRFLEIGKRDIYEGKDLGLRNFRKNLTYFSIDLDYALRSGSLQAVLKNLVNEIDAGLIEPLPHKVFPFSEAVDAFRYMAQGKHIGKIVLSMENAEVQALPARPAEFVPSGEGTYLVTGGVRGFGLACASWLVEQGARHIVLSSRSAQPDDEAVKTIAAMQKAGAEVAFISADVSCEDDVANLLTEIAGRMPPLRGILHAAMVIDDALMQDLTAERFLAVLAPKVSGAWNLHRQCAGLPLDFFVLFSSVGALTGNPGQSGYAAANAFLDGLAHYRRGLGLPALTIGWGVISGTGYLARNPKVASHLERHGWMGMPARAALRLLKRVSSEDAPHRVIGHVDWARFLDSLPAVHRSPRFSMLTTEEAAENAGNAGWLRQSILNATPEARAGLIEKTLREQIASVLCVPAEKHAHIQSLQVMGLDSLMAVELVNRIECALGVVVPLSRMSGNPTVSGMSVLLADLISGDGTVRSHVQDTVSLPAARETFLRSEAVLPKVVVPSGTPAELPASVLLLGSSGILGTHLLQELLSETAARVYFLTEELTDDAAREAIDCELSKFLPDSDIDFSRVIPVHGNITLARLGMDEKAFQHIAENVDAVWHNGAHVNHIVGYESLREANVGGMQEVIKLVAHGRPKTLHYISSMSVFGTNHGIVHEGDEPAGCEDLAGGYAESRWVTELIAIAARKQGLPVNIFRPGFIAGNSRTGIVDSNDLVWRMILSCIEIGYAPDKDVELNLTPPDFISTAAVHLSRTSGHTYHLVNPVAVSFRQLLAFADSALGRTTRHVSSEHWEQVIGASSSPSSHPLLPYMMLYPADKQRELHELDRLPQFDSDLTQAALVGSGIACPEIDEEFLRRVLARLRSEERPVEALA